MNNIYVFDIENFTEQDAISAKKLDKSDKVIFLPNQSGMISYALFPIISSWKTPPTFMQPIPGEKNEQALLFMLTLQCSNANGDLYIVMENNPFYPLDNCMFETEKGEITIHIFESFDQIMSSKPKRKPSEKKNTATNTSEAKFTEVENTATEENEIETEEYIGLEDDEKYSEGSEKFVNLLKELNKKTSLDLMSVKNAIYDCVKNSYEDVLGGLDFQIELRFKKEYVKDICSLLEPEFSSLKEAI